MSDSAKGLTPDVMVDGALVELPDEMEVELPDELQGRASVDFSEQLKAPAWRQKEVCVNHADLVRATNQAHAPE